MILAMILVKSYGTPPDLVVDGRHHRSHRVDADGLNGGIFLWGLSTQQRYYRTDIYTS